MRKTMSLLLCLVLSLSVVTVFTACGGGEEHTHTFATDWAWDDTNHWHNATCEHADVTSEFGAHVDKNNDDLCDVCSYAKDHTHTYDTTVWKWDESYHYHAGNCGHEVKQDEAAHMDENNDGLCDICAYDYDHMHTYANEWTHDATNHWHAPSCGHTVANVDTAAHLDEDNNGLCDVCAYDYDHTHTYADAWESDDVYHWHKADCGHDVISEKLQHKDANTDAYCDDCNKMVGTIVTYTATLEGSDYITVIDPATVTANAGAEVIFTFTASVNVAIDSVQNAELVGEPTEADGIKTYTVRIAALTADTTVTVLAHRVTNAEVVISDGKLEMTSEKKWALMQTTLELDLPSAGRYIIYSPDYTDLKFVLDGNACEQNDMAISYVFEATEAGKITLSCSRYADAAGTIEVTYVVIRVETTNAFNALEGSGYELPTNADIEVTFTVPAAGLWQITSSTPVTYNGDATVPHVFHVDEGALTRTITLHYNTTESPTFTFDWKIERLGGEPSDVTKGDNAVHAPLGGYTSVAFTPPASGAYRFTMSNEYINLNQWVDDEFGSRMALLDWTYLFEHLEAGKKYIFYVNVNIYGMEEITTDLDGTLTITYLGYTPDMSNVEDNVKSGTALVGTTNNFNNGSDDSEYTITAVDGMISLDGGATWHDTIVTTVAANQVLAYMVKGNDASATEVDVTFRRMVYEGSLSIGGANTVTMVPDKVYTLTLSGSIGGYYGSYQISWNDANVTLFYNGQSLTSPADIDIYNANSSQLTAVNNGSSEVTIAFTLTDTAMDPILAMANGKYHVKDGNNILYIVTFTPDYEGAISGTMMVEDMVSAGLASDISGSYTYEYNSEKTSFTVNTENFILAYNKFSASLTFQTESMYFGQVMVQVADEDEGGDSSDNVLKLGANSIEGTADGSYYSFSADEAGTYIFSFAEGETNGYPLIEDASGASSIDFPYTVTLATGETFTLIMSTDDLSSSDVIDIVITKA